MKHTKGTKTCRADGAVGLKPRLVADGNRFRQDSQDLQEGAGRAGDFAGQNGEASWGVAGTNGTLVPRPPAPPARPSGARRPDLTLADVCVVCVGSDLIHPRRKAVGV